MSKYRNPLANCPTLAAIVQGAAADDRATITAMIMKCSDADWQVLEKAIEEYIKTRRGKKK